jgi:AraC family transcriptional regulator of adaptative response / DNA-3-methyladenine glycosylase II
MRQGLAGRRSDIGSENGAPAGGAVVTMRCVSSLPPSDEAVAPPPTASPPTASPYAAFVSHDARFDGRLFVGVTSTGVYCRPVCRVRTPQAANCRFFGHPAAAESAGFRPCLRCRPELAPGLAPIDMPERLAWAAAQRIEAGELDAGGLSGLAARLGISDRHLRRVFGAAFGVTPVAYAQTQRLLLAKRLLTDSDLPATEVALAAGFGSLRRFQALFQSRYGLAPTALRHARAPARGVGLGGEALGLSVELGLRPPFDWPRWLDFLAGRAIPGVEQVEPASAPGGGAYRRSLALCDAGGQRRVGTVTITQVQRRPAEPALRVQVSPGLWGVLPAVLVGARRLADLGADPIAVAERLGALAADAPGLRVPGCFDGFELAVRAVLGQQVSVRAARTLAGRLVQALGEPLAPLGPGEADPAGLTHTFPTAEGLAAAAPEALGALGLVRQRVTAIQALARAVAEGRLDLGPAGDVDAALQRLMALPGIGPWTAQYIALRALAWPDAWPSGDVALIKALGAADAREADAMAQAWRPWRGYATLQLWRRLAEGAPAWKDPK